jgi:hypothetical protein
MTTSIGFVLRSVVYVSCGGKCGIDGFVNDGEALERLQWWYFTGL